MNLLANKFLKEKYSPKFKKNIRVGIQGIFLALFFVTFYAFKFPEHYRFFIPFDASYLFLLIFVLIAGMKRIVIPKIYAEFSIFFIIASLYCLVYSLFMGHQTLSLFNEFIEGDTYYMRSANSWMTSVISQIAFLCLFPPILCSFSPRAQVFSIRVFLLINAYFALIQVLSVFNLGLLELLPIHIGVNTSDGFNLSFGRAVGITAAHGAFYYSFGMLTSVLVLLALNHLRWFDIVLGIFSILSLSRSAMVISIFFVMLIMLRHQTRPLIYIIAISLMGLFAVALFNSQLWELRTLADNSGEIRGGQIVAAFDTLSNNPLGIGAQHPYFFDGSLTAILVEYGLIGMVGETIIIYLAYRILKHNFGFLQGGVIIAMGVIALALTGSPFAYLPTLFIGMLLYHSSFTKEKNI